ncbi:MAG TPA: 7TM diverse intracellular signaling domain-containing protein [Lunatimonas sp.]|nr:7TM diverse intracellular signaling domain-containing protein [Lunatimonas sp.]
MAYKAYLLILGILSCCFVTLARQGSPSVIELEDGDFHLPVIRKIDFYVDTTASKSVQEISSPMYQDRFHPVTSDNIVPQSLEDEIWLRMTVLNRQSNSDHSWYFESWGFDIDEITFYFPSETGEFIPTAAGYDLDFTSRKVSHKNFNFFLDLRPGDEKVYYLKVRRSYPLGFSFHLRTNERFISHSLNEYFLLGIYYGVLVLIMSFTVYLFIKLKDFLYFYFSILLLACIWFSLGRDGLGFQYLWPTSPWINKFTVHSITELGVILSTLLFSNHFVQKYTKSKELVYITMVAVVLKLILFMNQTASYTIAPTAYIFGTILILLVPFVTGLVMLLKVKVFSMSYTFAYACLFLVIVHSYTKEFAIFDDPVLNWYFVHPVIFLEVVFFSLSIFKQLKFLQDRYKEATREKTEALEEKNRLIQEMNTQLQQKVKERTREIELMAADLASKNISLQTTNLTLQELNSQVTLINNYLKENNEQLRISVEEVTKNLALMKGLDFDDFKKVFPGKDACLEFLSELKWKGSFKCKKCGFNKYTDGKNHSRRCKNCNYLESPTVDTLFHKLKFPIEKAFYILYLSNRKDIDLTLNELSEILELRRETCWAFKNKISQAMETVGHNKELNGWETLALVHLE